MLRAEAPRAHARQKPTDEAGSFREIKPLCFISALPCVESQLFPGDVSNLNTPDSDLCVLTLSITLLRACVNGRSVQIKVSKVQHKTCKTD